MPTKSVLALHDGRWWPAEVLDQYRDRADGSWRVVVTYSVAPGMRYIRAEPADRCRRLSEEQQDQAYDAQARRERPDRQDDPPW